MKVFVLVNILWVFLAASSLSYASPCELDDFPLMVDMYPINISGDSVHNNRPMLIWVFTTESSVAVVKDFYHRKWKKTYDDSAFAVWTQITSVNDDCMMMVQVTTDENSGGSHGRLVISNPPAVSGKAPVGQGVYRPFNATVVSDLASIDGKKHGRVSMLNSSDSPEEVARFYKNGLPAKGWQLNQQFSQGEAIVLVFRDGPDEYNVLITPAGELTQILINSVRVK